MPEEDPRPLRILASAIAGRGVEVAAAAPGARTSTDGDTIFLEAAEPRDQLRLLAVQAALLAGDSLGSDIVPQLRHHRALAARYLAIEGHRALAANEPFLPSWMLPMIDREQADRSQSSQESLSRARHERGIEPPWTFGTIDARRLARTSDREDGGSSPTPTTREAAIATLDERDEDDDGLVLGDLVTSPVGGGGPVGKLLARVLRPSRARDGGGPPGADGPTHVSQGRPGAGRLQVSARPSGAGLDGIVPGERTGRAYPEWDVREGRYRPDWCQVVDDEVDETQGTLGPPPHALALRRALATQGMGLTPCRRQRQGEDIDIDAAVEARVDHLAGSPHDDDVYIESQRLRRDLSVLVLLDVSGSSDEPGVGGRSVHEHQREAAAVLTRALFDLGDRVGLYAFRSRGRKDVRISRVKGFDERDDGRVAQRLDALRPGAYTRLGAAIRHGSWLLQAHSGTPRRLLVVLSDGFAYDHGYEGRYGEADARRALAEARWRGTGCLCLSVGTVDADHAALGRVFGTAAHAAVPTTEHLPPVIGRLFATGLASAESKRRSHQRRERTRARLAIEEIR